MGVLVPTPVTGSSNFIKKRNEAEREAARKGGPEPGDLSPASC